MRRIVVLLALLLAVGAYLRFCDRKPEQAAPVTEHLGLVVAGAADQTVQLLIDQKLPGQPFRQVSLRRHEVAGQAQWWLDAPHVRAADDRAEALYQALGDTLVRRRLRGARREPGYGLAGEGWRVRVLLKGSGPAQELRLGAEAPDGSIYGSREPEADVLVLEPRLLELLTQDRAALARTQMTAFDLEAGAIQRVVVGTLTVTRLQSSWQVEQRAIPAAQAQWMTGEDDAPQPLPDRGADRPPARARAVLVEDLIKTLREAQASDQLGGAGVPFRHTDLRIRPAPVPVIVNGTEQFFLGLPCPRPGAEPKGLLVRTDGARLCFPSAVLQRVAPAYEALRELRLVPFAAGDLARVRLAEGELRREGAGWTLHRGDAAQSVDGDAVAAFVAELLALEGVPAPGRARGDGGAEVTVSTRAGDALRLRVLDAAAGLVQRDGEEPLRVGSVGVLGAGALRFVPRLLQRSALYDIRRLRVGAEELRRVGERGPVGERYRLGSDLLPVDAERAARVLASFAELRAERYVAAAGSAMPLLSLLLEVDGVARPFAAEVLRDGALCLLRGPGVPAGALAVLSDALCADLQAPLVSRRLLMIDDSRLLRVRLRRGDGAPKELLDAAARAALPVLRRLERGEPAGYGPPPGGPALLTVELELTPVPARGDLLSDVPPQHQALSLYREGAGLRAVLRGRAVVYALPVEILGALGGLLL